MQKKKLNFKRLSFLILTIYSSVNGYAIEKINQKNFISLSFSNNKIENNLLPNSNFNNAQLEYSCIITNSAGMGAYMGYGIYDEWINVRLNNSDSLTTNRMANSLQYGVCSKLYLLPLFFENPITRIDLFLTARVGFIKLNSSKTLSSLPTRGNYFDYSITGGLTYFLSKKFGIFGEAGYMYFKFHDGFYARYGFCYRF
ncbi:MAG TPA: hypothetical protein PKH79_09410 [Prolixibacteraceae bacterium]|nr:hypothetical protein [Prolixibacteraceae bacterium]